MTVGENEINAFISECIDTVPHLEALLQVWKNHPKTWTDSELATRLYLDEGNTRQIMADLARRGLVKLAAEAPPRYGYASSAANDRLVDAVARAYQSDLIRITNAIHSKASPGVREFARAFRFTRKGKKR